MFALALITDFLWSTRCVEVLSICRGTITVRTCGVNFLKGQIIPSEIVAPKLKMKKKVKRQNKKVTLRIYKRQLKRVTALASKKNENRQTENESKFQREIKIARKHARFQIQWLQDETSCSCHQTCKPLPSFIPKPRTAAKTNKRTGNKNTQCILT